MTELVLFHHVLGLTDGVRSFADLIRAQGHTVHTPDLFEGRTFPSIDEGIGYAGSIGFDEVMRRGLAAAAPLPNRVVFGGFSVGVMPAQQLLQTTPEALGGLFLHAFIDPTELDGSLPAGVPAQVHGMDEDPFFIGDGDLEAARAVQSDHPELETFLYPGKAHLFTDSSSADYDRAAATQVLERTSAFLATFDSADQQ